MKIAALVMLFFGLNACYESPQPEIEAPSEGTQEHQSYSDGKLDQSQAQEQRQTLDQITGGDQTQDTEQENESSLEDKEHSQQEEEVFGEGHIEKRLPEDPEEEPQVQTIKDLSTTHEQLNITLNCKTIIKESPSQEIRKIGCAIAPLDKRLDSIEIKLLKIEAREVDHLEVKITKPSKGPWDIILTFEADDIEDLQSELKGVNIIAKFEDEAALVSKYEEFNEALIQVTKSAFPTLTSCPSPLQNIDYQLLNSNVLVDHIIPMMAEKEFRVWSWLGQQGDALVANQLTISNDKVQMDSKVEYRTEAIWAEDEQHPVDHADYLAQEAYLFCVDEDQYYSFTKEY